MSQLQSLSGQGFMDQSHSQSVAMNGLLATVSQSQLQQASVSAGVKQNTADSSSSVAVNGESLVTFSEEQSAALRCQVMAYRALADNKPVLPAIQQAIFVTGEASKFISKYDAAAALTKQKDRDERMRIQQAKKGKEDAAELQRTTEIERLRLLEENELPLGQVEDPTSLVYPYNAFTSPLDLFHNMSHHPPTSRAIRLIPTLLPVGLDPQILAKERNRFIQARVNQRINELENLPTVSSASHQRADSDSDTTPPPPVVISNASKIKALIELKSLRLLEIQKAMRETVVLGFNQASALSLPVDRSNFRRFKKQTINDARQTDVLESAQRIERERVVKQKHVDHLQQIVSHGRNLNAAHRSHQAKFIKLGKALLRFHVEADKEEQRRVEKVSKERLKALRADDEEGYLKLIDTAKDTRITHLLRQTDAFLDSLSAAVVAQQNDAVYRHRPSTNASSAAASTSAMVLDTAVAAPAAAVVSESTFGAAPVFEDEAAVPDKVDYYNVAHRIKETITEQPKMLIGGSLKSYQIKGLEWMISLYNNNVNGILADEMGLGKTIQTIALITHLIEHKQQNGPFLVIVPLSTMPNWIMEFEKWAPAVRMISYKGSPTQRKASEREIRAGNFQVLLTTYEYIIKDRALLAKIKWVHMIIDEGHRMKNAQSKLSITLTTYYSSRYRLILTGTPLQNNLPELWALLNFVLPRIFGSVKSFDEWFNAPFANTGGQDKIEVNEEESLLVIRRLHKVLRPFLLRRLKKDVEKDLPDKVERVIKCRMSSLQLKLTRQIKEHGMIFTDGPVDSKSRATGIKGLQNQIMQLRKICNHPFTFPEVERTIDATGTTDATLYRVAGKFEILDRILPKLFQTGHRVLMFFQMTTVMTIFEDYLNFRRIPHLRLDGTTKHEDRASLLKAFNAPNSAYPIFILSTRAGGLGLNLQTADTVIIFDSDWNPHQDLQAQDRAHRIGQKKEVRILRLVTERSVEELVMAGASRKIEMDKKVIQAGKYDNKSTAEERDEYLRALLDVADEEPEDDDELDEAEMLNEAIARTEEERTLFTLMDKTRREQEAAAWAASGNPGKMPERLIQEHELPLVYQMEHEKLVVADEIFEGDRRVRARNTVVYDDGGDDDLFAMDDDEEAEAANKKRANAEKRAATKQRKSQLSTSLNNTGSPSSSMTGGRTRAASHATNEGDSDDDGGKKRKRTTAGSSRGGSVDTSVGDGDESKAKRRKTQVVLTPMQEQMKAKFNEILDVLDDEDHPVHGHQRAGLFANLPSRKDYKDYYAITLNPISLKEIKKKVAKSEYDNINQMRSDIHLMCRNSMAYNAPDSIVYEDALSLQNTFDEQFIRLFVNSGLPGSDIFISNPAPVAQ